MYSESNFNSFKERLLQIYLEDEEKNIYQANEYAKNKLSKSKLQYKNFIDISMKENWNRDYKS